MVLAHCKGGGLGRVASSAPRKEKRAPVAEGLAVSARKGSLLMRRWNLH